MSNQSIDEQSLRLVKAFLEIKDHDARELMIAVAEAAARGEKIKDHPLDEATGPTR